jgi:hypothetical protein
LLRPNLSEPSTVVILRCSPSSASLEGWNSSALWQPGAATRQLTDFAPIGAQQSVFLGAAPAFDLALDRNSVGDTLKMLRPNENYGAP